MARCADPRHENLAHRHAKDRRLQGGNGLGDLNDPCATSGLSVIQVPSASSLMSKPQRDGHLISRTAAQVGGSPTPCLAVWPSSQVRSLGYDPLICVPLGGVNADLRLIKLQKHANWLPQSNTKVTLNNANRFSQVKKHEKMTKQYK